MKRIETWEGDKEGIRFLREGCFCQLGQERMEGSCEGKIRRVWVEVVPGERGHRIEGFEEEDKMEDEEDLWISHCGASEGSEEPIH